MSPSVRGQPTTKRTPSGVLRLRDVLQELATQSRHAPQLRERLGFDLADPLAADAKLLADFTERALVAAVQAEPQSQHLPLARMQLVQGRLESLGQIRGLGRLACRFGGRNVADQVAPRKLAIFDQRRLQR